MAIQDNLRKAGETYKDGYTCSQAVFCSFAKEMNLDEETACRLMEGYGGGIAGLQETCGAVLAAAAIISFYYSSGCACKQSYREEVFEKVKKATEIFRKEYGGINCKEILHGECPKAFQCGMKVKDAVLIISQILEEKEDGGN